MLHRWGSEGRHRVQGGGWVGGREGVEGMGGRQGRGTCDAVTTSASVRQRRGDACGGAERTGGAVSPISKPRAGSQPQSTRA